MESLLNEAQEDNLEFEVRFGKTENNKFIPSVSKEEYNNLVDYLGNDFVTERSIVWGSSEGTNIRMIYYLTEEKKILRKEIQRKVRIKNITLSNIRFSLSKEENLSKISENNKFNFIRYKNRYSYNKNSFRIDITKVMEEHFELKDNTKEALNKAFNKEPDKYEIEIEFVKKKSKDLCKELTDLINDVKIGINPLYKKVLLREQIYTEIKNILLKEEVLDFRKNLISKVRSLHMKDLGILNSQLYSVTDKADGERLLLYVIGKRGYLINSANEIEEIKLSKEVKQPAILDGELINSKEFLVFDCLAENGESRISSLLKERLLSAEKVIKMVKTSKISVKLKHFEFKEKVNEQVFKLSEKVLKNKKDYITDGLIFTPILEPYYNPKIFKWKPSIDLTIDFLVRKTGNPKIFNLFVGISSYEFKKNKLKLNTSGINYKKLFPSIGKNDNFFPVIFSYCPEVEFTNDTILTNGIRDDIIVELRYLNNRFEFVRVREDRTKEYKNGNRVYGNSWNVAVANWEIIKRPITEKMIIGKENVPFFAEERKGKSDILQMKKFHSSVKYKLYLEYGKNINWDLELAIGRYGDLPKWISAGIKNIVGFDIDRNALYEGEQLLENIVSSKKYKVGEIPKIYTTDADISKNLDNKIIELNKFFKLSVKENYFDIVCCQFALHFFLDTEESFDTFVSNVSKYVKKGGYFMATTSDGERVNNLFKVNGIKKDETLFINKDGNTVFSFQRLYNDSVENKILNTGQQISVYVDSIGNFHKEYLVNLDYVQETLKKYNFKKIKIAPFEEYYNKMKDNNMSKEEKVFSFLNVAMVFKKM